jgi:hypothetical protein
MNPLTSAAATTPARKTRQNILNVTHRPLLGLEPFPIKLIQFDRIRKALVQRRRARFNDQTDLV